MFGGIGGSFLTVMAAWHIAQIKATKKAHKPADPSAGIQVSTILRQILHKYDRKVRPDDHGQATQVNISMAILSFNQVSERAMDFSFSCYFRQMWFDPRLRFESRNASQFTTLPLNAAKALTDIWKPDTYFANGKSAFIHILTVPNRLLRIRSDGQILLSQRLTVTARCPMHLAKFPMDTQLCHLQIGSLGYSSDDLFYKWEKISVPENLFLSQFVLSQKIGTTETEVTGLKWLPGGKNETHSILIAHIYLKRQQGYYLLQVYIPSSMIVVLSWISFWLNQEAAIARCSLGVTTVLTMTTLRMGAQKDLPIVSYLTALDLFLLVSFGFIIAALVEYIIIHVVALKKMNKLTKEPGLSLRRFGNRMYQQGSADEDGADEDGADSPRPPPRNRFSMMRRKSSSFVNRIRSMSLAGSSGGLRGLAEGGEEGGPALVDVAEIDTWAKFVFPGAFALFNIVYWPAYLFLLDDVHPPHISPL